MRPASGCKASQVVAGASSPPAPGGPLPVGTLLALSRGWSGTRECRDGSFDRKALDVRALRVWALCPRSRWGLGSGLVRALSPRCGPDEDDRGPTPGRFPGAPSTLVRAESPARRGLSTSRPDAGRGFCAAGLLASRARGRFGRSATADYPGVFQSSLPFGSGLPDFSQRRGSIRSGPVRTRGVMLDPLRGRAMRNGLEEVVRRESSLFDHRR